MNDILFGTELAKCSSCAHTDDTVPRTSRTPICFQLLLQLQQPSIRAFCYSAVVTGHCRELRSLASPFLWPRGLGVSQSKIFAKSSGGYDGLSQASCNAKHGHVRRVYRHEINEAATMVVVETVWGRLP